MIAPGEPQWLPDDTDAALAWQAAQGDLCPGCGKPRDECFAADGPHYEAVPLRCRACEARDVAARNFAETGSNAGMYFAVKEHRG